MENSKGTKINVRRLCKFRPKKIQNNLKMIVNMTKQLKQQNILNIILYFTFS